MKSHLEVMDFLLPNSYRVARMEKKEISLPKTCHHDWVGVDWVGFILSLFAMPYTMSEIRLSFLTMTDSSSPRKLQNCSKNFKQHYPDSRQLSGTSHIELIAQH